MFDRSSRDNELTVLNQEYHPLFCFNFSLTLFFIVGSIFLAQVRVGPFTIIRSIDSLTETLADLLAVEGRGFTISTKNIGNKIIFK